MSKYWFKKKVSRFRTRTLNSSSKRKSITSNAAGGKVGAFNLEELITKPKLLLVADLGTLKAYRLEFSLQSTPRLEELETDALEEAHVRVIDKVTDLAGRRGAPTKKNWGAPLSDEHNLEIESKRRLIRRIADRVEYLIQRSDYPGCWLAAHKEICHHLVQELTPSVRDRIQRVIPCDLTKATHKEIIDQFLNSDFRK